MRIRRELARLPGLVVDVGFERFVASLSDEKGQFLTTIRKDNVRKRCRHKLRFGQPISFVIAVDDRTGIARHRVEIIGRPVHRWETAAFKEAVMPALRRYRRGEASTWDENTSTSVSEETQHIATSPSEGTAGLPLDSRPEDTPSGL